MAEKKKKKVPGLYLRPDGVYEKRITVNGKRLAFRHTDPNEVWRKMAAHQEEKDKGRYFEKIIDAWEEQHSKNISHNTMQGYRPAIRRLRHEFEGHRVGELTPQQIDRYIKRFAVTRAYKTVANELMVLRMVFEYACREGDIDNSPVEHIQVPSGLKKNERPFPTDKEIEIVKKSYDQPYGLLYYTVLYTGCRLGEALALQKKDIDFKNGWVYITKSVYNVHNQPHIKQPKTKSGTREVVLMDKLREVLEPRIKSLRPEDYIFAEQGRLPSRTMVDRGRQRFRKATGVTADLHSFRHVYTSMVLEQGVAPEVAQYLLGHAQLSTTMDIYNKIRKQRLVDAAKKLKDADIDVWETFGSDTVGVQEGQLAAE